MATDAWANIANIGLTFGLLVFAAMQWWVTHQAERRERQKQAHEAEVRRLDEERERDRAYQLAWAEHFRLHVLAEYWKAADLVDLSLTGALQPEYVTIHEGERIIEALTKLGIEAGYLGAVALSLSHDIARDIQQVNGIVHGWFAQFEQGKHPYLKCIELTKVNIGSSLDVTQESIKRRVAELANLLLDALGHSESGDKLRQLRFNENVSSDFARAAIAALTKRAEERAMLASREGAGTDE